MSQGTTEVYTWRDAVPADADQLAARWRAGAAYLTILVLQLNPGVPLVSETTWRWFLTLGLFYGVHLAVIFYLLMVVREFFALDALSPGWASVRVLAWLRPPPRPWRSTLMWLNVRGLRRR